MVPFDDLFTAERLDPIPPLERERQNNAAAHIALITFDVGDNGIVPVARNHLELLAGGLAVTLESRVGQDGRILSTIAPSSFAGISLTLMPWLLSAGTLSLHHPFDPQVLAQQRRGDKCSTLILPGPVALRLAEAGTFARDGVGTVIGAWRSPERLATSPAWRESGAVLVDVSIFGEAGLVAARRGAGGRRGADSVRPGHGAARQQRARSSSPNWCARRRAPWRCADRWCRATPFRLESNAPACPISRSSAPDWSTPATPAASIRASKAMVVTGPPFGHRQRRRLSLPAA